MTAVSAPRSLVLRCGRFRLDLTTPRVMGVVNLTPDSFSDGGRVQTFDDAVRLAHRLIDEGADLVDVGAESTRPGAAPVPADEELARLGPFLEAMRGCPVPLSVDTRKPAIMRAALDLGASMINDIAGFATAEARATVRTADCGLCVMHMQGEPATMQRDPRYDEVVSDVASFLRDRVDALVEDGVDAARLCVDPGFGFGKTFDHNLALLRGLRGIAALGRPVLVGLSRKGMIGTITGRAVGARLAGSVAAALAAVDRGATIVRVHDVAATVDALKVRTAVR